jgi:hypothetical protein
MRTLALALYLLWSALCTFYSSRTSPAAEVLAVKVVVDEEEATVPRVWQARLGSRLERASDIIEPYCGVRFVASVFGTWDSDDQLQAFGQTLRELEREVPTGPAHMVIGFSSQYRFQRGHNNLGGTRGPLCSHILIRENAATVLEPERLEVLIHELGHFLGAAHSNLPTSVMRPIVGDGQARARSFAIGFDPDNAQIIRLIGQELRDRRIRSFRQLSPATLAKLDPYYRNLAKASPRDLAAAQCVSVIDKLMAAHRAQANAPGVTPP